MNKTALKSIQQELKEAIAIRRGELAAGRIIEVNSPDAKSKPAPALPTIAKKEPKTARRVLHS